MNYQAHYDRLIQRARERMLDGYVERHHVIPRCMGGNDDVSNLVQLTAEEHYVAHQLLCKMYPSVRGLAFAAQAMTCSSEGRGTANKLFGWIRRRYAEAQRGRVKSEQERKNIAEAGRNRKRRVFSEQARANMAAARLKTWEERRATGDHLSIAKKTKETRIKNGSYEFSDSHRANIGASSIGREPWNKGIKAKGPGQVSFSNC